MKKALVILGALVFLAAGKEPTVRVENSSNAVYWQHEDNASTQPCGLSGFQDWRR